MPTYLPQEQRIARLLKKLFEHYDKDIRFRAALRKFGESHLDVLHDPLMISRCTTLEVAALTEEWAVLNAVPQALARLALRQPLNAEGSLRVLQEVPSMLTLNAPLRNPPGPNWEDTLARAVDDLRLGLTERVAMLVEAAQSGADAVQRAERMKMLLLDVKAFCERWGLKAIWAPAALLGQMLLTKPTNEQLKDPARSWWPRLCVAWAAPALLTPWESPFWLEYRPWHPDPFGGSIDEEWVDYAREVKAKFRRRLNAYHQAITGEIKNQDFPEAARRNEDEKHAYWLYLKCCPDDGGKVRSWMKLPLQDQSHPDWRHMQRETLKVAGLLGIDVPRASPERWSLHHTRDL